MFFDSNHFREPLCERVGAALVSFLYRHSQQVGVQLHAAHHVVTCGGKRNTRGQTRMWRSLQYLGEVCCLCSEVGIHDGCGFHPVDGMELSGDQGQGPIENCARGAVCSVVCYERVRIQESTTQDNLSSRWGFEQGYETWLASQKCNSRGTYLSANNAESMAHKLPVCPTQCNCQQKTGTDMQDRSTMTSHSPVLKTYCCAHCTRWPCAGSSSSS